LIIIIFEGESETPSRTGPSTTLPVQFELKSMSKKNEKIGTPMKETERPNSKRFFFSKSDEERIKKEVEERFKKEVEERIRKEAEERFKKEVEERVKEAEMALKESEMALKEVQDYAAELQQKLDNKAPANEFDAKTYPLHFPVEKGVIGYSFREHAKKKENWKEDDMRRRTVFLSLFNIVNFPFSLVENSPVFCSSIGLRLNCVSKLSLSPHSYWMIINRFKDKTTKKLLWDLESFIYRGLN
jgi:hypothetical protein